jgi:peptide/nickel transport system permease protein
VVGWARSLALPAVALAAVQVGFTARMTRSAMLEVLHQDFILTADAKGLKRRIVAMGHGLPNALLMDVLYAVADPRVCLG